MRYFYYIDYDSVLKLAADCDINLDFEIYEYSEKRMYGCNCSSNYRPEIENTCNNKKSRFSYNNDNGKICNYEIQKRHIIIDELNNINKKKVVYRAVDELLKNDRIEVIVGKIDKIENNLIYAKESCFIIDREAQNSVLEPLEYNIRVHLVGYKINCLYRKNELYKLLCVFIQ